MALNERLSKFKQQQERCQTTLSSIAATQASTTKSHNAPRSKPANAPSAPAKQIQAIKFSNDTERLQHINSVRKSPVGAQIKLVIELLYKVICRKFNLMGLPRLLLFRPMHIAIGFSVFCFALQNSQ